MKRAYHDYQAHELFWQHNELIHARDETKTKQRKPRGFRVVSTLSETRSLFALPKLKTQTPFPFSQLSLNHQNHSFSLPFFNLPHPKKRSLNSVTFMAFIARGLEAPVATWEYGLGLRKLCGLERPSGYRLDWQ